ncbi:6-carboxytetrahydropterin synthase [Photorhabdus bodei]|nr:6-carboxytetrahydropterin synthase [Photorhabdus bodei]
MNIDSIGIMMQRDDIGFSASHFTIFSEFERETLHGHNFNVGVEVYSEYEENGMIFDYCIIKKNSMSFVVISMTNYYFLVNHHF